MGSREQRFHQIILGALLSARLDTSELMEVAHRLQRDRLFTDKLGRLVLDSSHLIASVLRAPDRSNPSDQDDFGDSTDELMRLFERKRLPKTAALSILRSVSRSVNWRSKVDATLRQNIIDLLQSIEKGERRQLLIADVARALGVSADPYLRELVR